MNKGEGDENRTYNKENSNTSLPEKNKDEDDFFGLRNFIRNKVSAQYQVYFYLILKN